MAGPVLIALAVTLAVMTTLAPHTGGPGVTCDELDHVYYGKELVRDFRHQGLAFFTPANIQSNFNWKVGGPPVHPPLGNWIIGWTHHLFDPAPDNREVISIAAARFAPALALGLLVLMVGLWTTVREGPLAGSAAAAAVALVPRVFAHGHLAALDTLTALFFTAALLAVAEAQRRDAKLRHFALAGVFWGLAMLVRLHGILLLPAVVVWVAWRLRRRAAAALAVWGAAGLATFFVGWPWLWLAPWDHFRQFLAAGTSRTAVHVFYAGQVWADRDAPWHYPLVMFVLALPVGLLALGAAGAWARRRQVRQDSGQWLALGTAAMLLLLFAWPGVPVYDGVRLFLMVFPLWAVSVGVGVRWAFEHPRWASMSVRGRIAILGIFLALQGVPLVLYHPCQLSHYNLLVGGLLGAEKAGFEVTYWGDAVTESLLAEAAAAEPGGKILYGPNLAPFQSPAVQISSPALLDGRVRLVPWEPSNRAAMAGCRLGLFYHRRADLDCIPEELLNGEVLVEHRIQGGWVARLVRLPKPMADNEAP